MSLVYIWENNLLPGGRTKLTGGHTWVGHASMNIGDALDPLPTEQAAVANMHVSWVPGGDSDVKEKRLKGYALQSSGTNISHIVYDVGYETYWPDHVIQLPDGKADLLKAQAAWKDIRTQPGAAYKMLNFSCSTVVAKVLKAGGFSAGSVWADNNLVWTPIKVRDFALDAGGKMLTFVEFVTILSKVNLKDADFTALDDKSDVIRNTRDGQFTTLRGPSGPKHNPTSSWTP